MSDPHSADVVMRMRLLSFDWLLERLLEVDAEALTPESVQQARLDIREVFRLYVDTNGTGQRLFDIAREVHLAPGHERRQLLERRIVEAGAQAQAASLGPRGDPGTARAAQTVLNTLQAMRVDFPTIQAVNGMHLPNCVICSGAGPDGPLQALCQSSAATCPTLVHEECWRRNEGAPVVCAGCPAGLDPAPSVRDCVLCSDAVSENLQC
jgi:hypothetical protein